MIKKVNVKSLSQKALRLMMVLTMTFSSVQQPLSVAFAQDSSEFVIESEVVSDNNDSGIIEELPVIEQPVEDVSTTTSNVVEGNNELNSLLDSESAKANDSPVEDTTTTLESTTEEEKDSKNPKTVDDIDWDDAESIKAALKNPDFQWVSFDGTKDLHIHHTPESWIEFVRTTREGALFRYQELTGFAEVSDGVGSNGLLGVVMGGAVLGHVGGKPLDIIDQITVDGRVAFCLDPNAMYPGNTYSTVVYRTGTTALDDYLGDINKARRIAAIATVAKNYDPDTSSISMMRYGTAQFLIWQAQGYSIAPNGVGYSSSIADEINEGVNKLLSNITLDKTSATVPASGGTVTFRITSGNFKTYVSNANGMDVSISGDTVTVRVPAGHKGGRVALGKGAWGAEESFVQHFSNGTQDLGILNYSDPNRATLTINVEEAQTGRIRLTKTADGNPNMSGIKFRVDLTGAVSRSFEITLPANGVWTSDSFPVGTNFTLTEIQTLDGYVLNTTPLTGKITTKDQIVTVSMHNSRQLTRVKLTKTGDGSQPLQGAKFELRNAQGSVVFTGTTGADGTLTSSELAPGNYTWVEIEAPTNYKLDATPRPVTAVAGSVANVTVSNELLKGSVKLTKTGDENKPLEGAKFELRDSQGRVVFTGVTNAQGIIEKGDLVQGTYTWVEVEAPADYQLNGTPISVKVEPNKVSSSTATNILKPGTARLTKKGHEGVPLQGVKFELRDSKGVVVFTGTTNAQGIVEKKDLPPGEYTWVELETLTEYVLDGTPVKTTVIPGGTANAEKTNRPKLGKVLVKKVSSKSILTFNLDEALAGAEFQLLKGSEVIATSTTNDKGEILFDNLWIGTYTLRETKAPQGYRKAPDQMVEVTEDGKTYELKFTDEPHVSEIELIKVDSQSGLPVKWAGTQFKIKSLTSGQFITDNYYYKGINGTAGDNVELVFTVDENGKIKLPFPLMFGKYELHEVKAPQNYVLSKKVIPFEVDDSGKALVTVEFANERVKGKITINKVGAVADNATVEDTEFGPIYTLHFNGSAKLAGAKFNVIAEEEIVGLDGTKYHSKGDIVGTVTTNGEGIATLGDLEIGKYSIQEIEAPAGFVLNSDKIHFMIAYAGQEVPIVSEVKDVRNEWGVLKLILKKLEQQQSGLDLSKDSKKGEPTFVNVPTKDKVFVIGTYKPILRADGQQLVPANGVLGILVTDGAEAKEFTTKLPAGDYFVKEVKSTENLILDTTEYKFSYVPNTTSGVQTIDMAQTAGLDFFLNELEKPEIKTKMITHDGGKEALPLEKSVWIDHVSYTNLFTDGREYTMNGHLRNAKTGEILKDKDGKPYEASTTFVPTERNGKVKLVFYVDASLLAGVSVVAFEDLYQDGIHIATHSDLTDKDQTIDVLEPTMKTTAQNTDGTKVFHHGDKVNLDDIIDYTNLIPGAYLVKGQLINTKDMKSIKDVEIPVEVTSKDGQFVVPFEFSTLDLPDDVNLVVFERLYKKPTKPTEDIPNVPTEPQLVITHEDPNDPGQTVRVVRPKLKTTFMGIDGNKDLDALGVLKLVDIVELTDVKNGSTYDVTGRIFNKTTGKLLVDADGKEITSTFKVTVNVNGAKAGDVISTKVEVPFEIDASQLAGTELVAFEDLSQDGLGVIAEHRDVNDKDQTVEVKKPKIGTRATIDGEQRIFTRAGKVVFVDRIDYEDLVVGNSYDAELEVMNKATGEPHVVNGQPVKATVSFVATAQKGYVDVSTEFEMNGFVGDLVAFETVFTTPGDNNGNRRDKVAEHKDINDSGQTVRVDKPEIGTRATIDGEKRITTKDGNVTFVDRIDYKGLTVGEKHQADLVIMDKATGKPLVINGKEITAKAEFTPTSANGYVDVTVQFELKGFVGNMVAFEEVSGFNAKGELVKIAEHKDINDAGQTVTIDKKVVPSIPSTGGVSGSHIALFIALAVVMVAGLVLFFTRKRKV